MAKKIISNDKTLYKILARIGSIYQKIGVDEGKNTTFTKEAIAESINDSINAVGYRLNLGSMFYDSAQYDRAIPVFLKSAQVFKQNNFKR